MLEPSLGQRIKARFLAGRNYRLSRVDSADFRSDWLESTLVEILDWFSVSAVVPPTGARKVPTTISMASDRL